MHLGLKNKKIDGSMCAGLRGESWEQVNKREKVLNNAKIVLGERYE